MVKRVSQIKLKDKFKETLQIRGQGINKRADTLNAVKK